MALTLQSFDNFIKKEKTPFIGPPMPKPALNTSKALGSGGLTLPGDNTGMGLRVDSMPQQPFGPQKSEIQPPTLKQQVFNTVKQFVDSPFHKGGDIVSAPLRKTAEIAQDAIERGTANLLYRTPISGRSDEETKLTPEDRKRALKSGPVGSFGYELALRNAYMLRNPEAVADSLVISRVKPGIKTQIAELDDLAKKAQARLDKAINAGNTRVATQAEKQMQGALDEIARLQIQQSKASGIRINDKGVLPTRKETVTLRDELGRYNGSKSLKGEGEIPAQLLQEAKKYKSADEFVSNYPRGMNSGEVGKQFRAVNAMENQRLVDRFEDVAKVNGQLSKWKKANKKSNPEAGFIDFEEIKKSFKGLLSKKGSSELAETTPQSKAKGKLLTPKELLPGKDSLEDVSTFYNVNRLNVGDEVKQAISKEISDTGESISKIVGGKLSNKEVLDLADTTSKVLNKTVSRQQTAEKIAANLKLRQKIAQVAKEGKVDKDFIDLWMKDKSAGEDIARQLQARRINADPKETGLIDSLLESIYKVNKNADEVAKAAEGVDFNNKEQVTEFYRKFVKPKASEWVDTLRYNSMLSSPNTHIINISSNFQGTGILTPIEKTITGSLDALRSALTGNPRQYAVGEGAAYAKGYYSKLAQASSDFWGVMTGKKFSIQPDVPISSQIPKATSKIGRATESTLSFPTRLLEAADNFFAALTEGGEKAALSYKTSKGIKEPKGLGSITDKVRERLFRGELNVEKQGALLNAIDDVTGKILALRSSDNPVTSTIAKFTLPFVKTPMNLLKQGIEYSPAGLLTLPGAKNKTEQLSKIIIGMGSAAGAATLLGQDRLTWAEPTNPNQKAAFRDAGRQPYSIKIGDKWVSYSKLHPALAFNFALIASLDNEMKNQKLDESQADSVLSAFAKWGNFLADQSYLKNIGDFVSGTKGDVEGYAKTLSNYPTQLIPFRALMSWLERLTDPVQRQADPEGSILDKQMQLIASQIPGLAQSVPARTNAKGKPILNQNRLLNAFSPNRVTTVNPEAEKDLRMKEQMKQAEQAIKVEKDMKKALVEPVYNEVQRLIKDDKIEEAQRIVDSLSDEDYDTYKSIKQAEQSKRTDQAKITLYPTYLEVQQLLSQGKEEDAQAIIDSMSNEDYRIYKLLKNQYE